MACLREQEIEPGAYVVQDALVPGLQYSNPSDLD
jgi:hypothetical protein